MLKIHKLLALLLSVMLLVSALPITAFAEAESTVDSEVTMELPAEPETIVTDESDTPEATEPIAEPESSNDEAPSDEQAEETFTPEDAPTEESQVVEAEEEIVPDETVVPVPDNIESVIAVNGHVYVMTAGTTVAYATADRTELVFTITQDGAVLLATEYLPRADASSVKVWFLTADGETITAYISEAALSDAFLTDEEANALADTQHAAWVSSDAGELLAFVVAGEKSAVPTEAPAEVIPSQEPTQEPIAEEPTSTPTQEPVPSAEPEEVPTPEPALSEPPAEEATPEPVPEMTETPILIEEPTEVPAAEPPSVQAGDFVTVTTHTRVYPRIDETAADDYDGDSSLGVFVNDASVQVETVEQDSLGRYWYSVRYMYGDDFADGTLKWTDYDTLYVLASETAETTEQDFTVTDYAFTSVPRTLSLLRSTTPMNGFSLKTINAAIPSLYVGQSGVYGSSGKDSDYLQIAKSTDHGTIYATPHYLNGFTVYCLEHNYPGPGENISGGGQEPTGPYLIVDIDSYRNTPGYSSIIYHASTLHAIAWVLRHTYPFMVLNRSDSDNEVWSRVAGQFAIRQVIRELEGAQYVRSYWNMDNFYRASGQAPAVYLEYARWLAANGIARASITGNINVSGKSVTSANGTYTGTVTLTTDADLMRVSKSIGNLTGNTAGSDGSYYYLNSGDTVSVSSSANSFTMTVESVSSEDEEASFLVGVPSVELQKMLIPQYGSPYKLKSVSVQFEVPLGSVAVAKTDAITGAVLAGAVFELLDTAGNVLQTKTTNASGIAAFANLQPGTYRVREKTAPEGYSVSVTDMQSVMVTAGTISAITFANDTMTAKIRIIKTDQLTKQRLSGVEFTITRLSAPAGRNGIGEVVAIITTDENGAAETGWLDWGRYRIEETKVPEHFVDNNFSTEIEAHENGETYTVEVENEPAKGWIRITKTDALDSTPIAGVVFYIYSNDEYGSELVGSMTTGKDSVAVSEPLRKGRYIVLEHDNPIGYMSELAEVNAVVMPDEITDISASNTPIQGKIRIVKKDQLTGEALSGAEFTITRVSGLPSHNGSNDGEAVAIITTDANGIAESPLLTWGTYKVEETVVPQHFVDNAFSTEVVIDTENQTSEIIAENEPTKGWLKLTKTDRQNGNPIEGVQFDIYYNDAYGEGLAGTMVTGADGIAVSEPLRKGRYIVREHGETAGYVFEEITLDATVKSDETTELFVTNCPVTVKLKLYKRDADEYDGDNPNASANAKVSNLLPEFANISASTTRGDGVLTSAEFQVLAGADITDRQGNVVYAKGDVVVDSLKTAGDDASVTTDELWPGLYEIVEITPPTGYQPSETTFFVDARSAAAQSTEAVVTYEGLKTNEIMTGLYAIVKFLGDNEVHDDAGIVETPEAGAEFEVYLKSAGSYKNAREFERDYITTNQYGYAKTKLLPYGVYVLKQVKGQDGYAIKSPIDIFIRGTEDPDDPPILTINNEAIRYRLKFIKVDGETDNTIAVANTAFKLKDGDGNYVIQTVHYPNEATIDTFYTDETGEVTLPETVTYGLYSVEELVSPEGYLILTEDLDVFVGDEIINQPGEAYLLEIEIPNEPVKGNIVVEKKGSQLTGFETQTDAYGNEVQHPIYEETYLASVVFEVRAAETIIGKDGTLWYEQDELVDIITTTASGADASMLLPLGRYYLIETAAPEGYAFDDTRYEADLVYADDQTPIVETKITFVNEYLPVEITFQKEKETLSTVIRDDGTITQILANAPGQGFVFGLYNDKDIHYSDGTLMADTLVATGSTDADGNLTFAGHYPHGDYYIKELSAPDGWELNPDVFPITLDPSAQSDSVIRVAFPEAVHDELIYNRITLTKTDITGEKTLPGALIEVINSSGEVIYRAYTDENGQIPGIPVTPGTYTFREVLAPDGYALSESEMRFTVDEYGNVTGDTVIRDDYTCVSLRKQNEDGLPLAGVEFALLKEDGSTLMTAVSNELGLVTFEKIPYGNYTIVETAPPTGYLKSDASIQLTVDGSFVNPTEPIAMVENCPNKIILKKVDTEGNPLAGAAFALLNVYGEQVMTAVSDADGIAHFVKIPYGQYTLSETQAPDGFSLMEDIPLTVDGSWTEPVEYTCVDIPNHYEFIKVDNRRNPLAGVKFVLEDAEGNCLRDLISGDDGIVHVTDLSPGTYIIRETETLEGFNKSDETNELVIDENYVAPGKLYRFVNYSGIQTGFEMAITPVMWGGLALVMVGAVLAFTSIRKSKRKRAQRKGRGVKMDRC